MVNLDQLLDHHELTSAQELELRRLLNYSLVKENDSMYFQFCYKKDNKPMHRVMVKSADLSKDHKYNEIMHKLIKIYSADVDSILVIRKIKELIKNDPLIIQHSGHEIFGAKIRFKNDFANMTLPYFTVLTPQTLFQTLKLVWADK